MKRFLIIFIFFLACNLYPKTDDSILLKKSFEILNLLEQSQWQLVYNYFDSTMKSVFPPDKIKETWETIGKQIGEIENNVDTTFSEFKSNRIVILTFKFKVMYADLRFVYNQQSELSGFFIAPNYNYSDYQIPAYADVNKFIETKYKFGKKGWELDAILTLPKKKKGEEFKNFPVVILVHGSGPNDMDETIGPNKPFKDLACGLASKGIAVFRFNKRTQQHPEKILNLLQDFTIWEETIEDVILAIEKLSNNPDIDPQQIYVLGHSLGGYLIPKISQTEKYVGGFVIMAGFVRPLEELIWEQFNYLFSLDDQISEEEKNKLDSLKQQIELVKSQNLTKEIPANKLPLGVPASYWLDLKGYNPLEIIKTTKTKFLVLQGEKDYQVSMKDFELWKYGLKDNSLAKFKSYSSLNHLFMESEGKSSPAEYLKANHIPEYVIDDIVEFILK